MMSDVFYQLVSFDETLRTGSIKYVVGVDEAGRGSLAGSLFAAAVVLHTTTGLEGVNDSKRLRPLQRGGLAATVRASSRAWAVATVSAAEIDERGLDWANRIVFTRAVRQVQQQLMLSTRDNTLILVDGIRPPLRCPLPYRLIKGGDGLSLSIAAASILAKTDRDLYCNDVLHSKYPQYGFDQHKGYATSAHYEALAKYGPSALHRRSYTLVRSS